MGTILPSLDMDVLIFHGTTDDMIDLKYSEEAMEVLPSARLVEVEGFGHGLPVTFDCLTQSNLLKNIFDTQFTHICICSSFSSPATRGYDSLDA